MRFSSKEEMLLYSEAKKREFISFGRDIGKWVSAGIPVVSEEVFNSRIAICKDCEFWNKDGFAKTGSCTKCGCSTQAKLRMATAKCPIDKWTEAKNNS